jgi:predicted NAD/FAD-binding protein
MRIAVIGSGIAGMGAALALSEEFDVRLIEAAPRFGGHAHTVDVAFGAEKVAVDTGFIVYNERNYPNLCGLFEHLGVPTKWSDMSFGFSLRDGQMEWAGDGLHTVFAQARNLFRPSFVKGVLEILRFNRQARAALETGALCGIGLGEWLARERYSHWFRDCYILPMGGAIWSTPVARMLDFPAESFVSFFSNHDLLSGMEERQRWRTVNGGSREYVDRLVARLGKRAVAGRPAVRITRTGGVPHVSFADGSQAVFDQVVLACHGPEARALLADADDQEHNVLGAFRTSMNRAILHSDPALMPRRRKVWSSWNFLSGGPEEDFHRPAPVTYWMNRLQGIDARFPLFVSLNPGREPDPRLVHAEFDYAHPVLDGAAFAAQRAMPAIQGRGGVWYAGAWLGYGFHEDGLRSGLAAAAALGARPSWARDLPDVPALSLAEAAE